MKERLAIDGGTPVRAKLLPYGKQSIDEQDVAAVVEVLQSDWLTTGPKVAEFERAIAAAAGTRESVAVSNGTAALHAAMYALGIGPGDEVIVPAITFAASANCAAFLGGPPVFADVDPGTLLIDPEQVEARISRQDEGRDRGRLCRATLRLRPLAGAGRAARAQAGGRRLPRPGRRLPGPAGRLPGHARTPSASTRSSTSRPARAGPWPPTTPHWRAA